MTTATRPNRTTSIAKLQRAIHAFNGYTGPGQWTVDGSGRSFIALTFTCSLADLPSHAVGDEPWDHWGGEEILTTAKLDSDRTMSGEESRSYFASAIIFVEN